MAVKLKTHMTVELSGLNGLFDKYRTPTLDAEMRKIVDEEIKPRIAKGISPVRGYRNFPKYKNPKSYPGNRKPSNKPNLELTGEMLSFYRAVPSKARSHSTTSYRFGLVTSATQFAKDKAEWNNYGTSRGVPARKFVPDETQAETYQVSIMLAIREAFARAVSAVLALYKRDKLKPTK